MRLPVALGVLALVSSGVLKGDTEGVTVRLPLGEVVDVMVDEAVAVWEAVSVLEVVAMAVDDKEVVELVDLVDEAVRRAVKDGLPVGVALGD